MSNTQWLTTWHSNGVHVSSHELMYYRSKVGAFQRFRRLNPPPSQTGALMSKFKGRGMEFDEFRHYQAGDDIRAIDWRVTARTGTPHTKLFREERERPVFVVVDLSDSMHFGSQLLLKSVQACHLAAALAWLAVARNDRIGALISTSQDAGTQGHVELRPQARHHGVLNIIHHLVQQQTTAAAQWQQQRGTSNHFHHALERLQHVARPGSLIYLISDWLNTDASTWRSLLALQRHCQLQAFQIIDPLELAIPTFATSDQLPLTNDGQQVIIDPSNQHQTQAYAKAMQQHQQAMLKQWQQLGLTVQQFSAAEPIELQWPGVIL